ncbi:tau 95 subunit of transcription factor TFIIIC, partial [Coemansia nantahalensis]
TGDGPAPAEEEEAQVRAEVVAVLDRTVRFRKLADFQYIVPRTDAIAQFARLTNGIDIDIDAVKQLGASSLLDEAPGGAVGYVPAPFLDRRGWPSQYQHAAAGGSGADGAQASDAHQRRRREGGKPTFHGIYMKFDAESVPERPSAAAERECRGVPARALQKAQRILDEFPVINRAAVEALLPPAECGGHRQTTIMPLLAYLMDTGPWRNCWIRLGYDPRKDPGSCKYQILDIRNANTGVSVGRVRMNPRSTLAQTQPDDAPPAAATARTRGHVFDDEAVRQKAAGIFQFMHVEVQPLRELIDYMPGRRQTPCEYSGWLQPSVMRTMRLKLR